MVYVSNLAPLRDVSGGLMDVHDGTVAQWHVGGRYFMYGMSYRNCTEETSWMPPHYCPGVYAPFGRCGFREDHGLAIYSSTDLVSWSYEGEGLPMSSRPRGIYFRPKVVFDATSGQFVLWINLLPSAPAGASWPHRTPLYSYAATITHLVARSSSPVGPFAVVAPSVHLGVGQAGDFSLLLTAAGAYIAYDAWDNGHAVRVERLNDDLTAARVGAEHTSGDVSPHDNEAPILFERAGWFYLAYGHICCFCAEGGGATLLVARHPLGPWSATGADLNPRRRGNCGARIPAQNNHVFVARTRDGGSEYIFVADLWQSSPDGLKSHDLQFWAPLRFNDTASPPTIAPLEWIDGFEIDLPDSNSRNGSRGGGAVDLVAATRVRHNAHACVDSSGIHPQLLWRLALTTGLAVTWCAWLCMAMPCGCRSGGGARRRVKLLM